MVAKLPSGHQTAQAKDNVVTSAPAIVITILASSHVMLCQVFLINFLQLWFLIFEMGIFPMTWGWNSTRWIQTKAQMTLLGNRRHIF